MEALWSSFLLVAASEFGDKTQLLAFALASRFRKPLPVLAGIFVATVVNHALASELGSLASGILSDTTVRYILAASFFGFAAWTLKPDSLDMEIKESKSSPFITTVVLFFLAEMGDKSRHHGSGGKIS